MKNTKNVLIISASFRPNSNSHALCQEVAKIKGFLKAGGVYEPGAVKKTKFMKAAFDLGRRI